MRTKSLVLAVGAALLGLAPVAVSGLLSPAPVFAQGAPPPPAVTIATVERKNVPLSYEYAGRVSAFREVEVRARVAGILMSRNFTEGATVKEGDVLFRIDPATYEAEVARASAQVQRAEAALKQAENDSGRASALFDRKFGTEKARDDAASAVETAKADLAVAQAQLKTAEINLGYTTVRAPITGVTSLKVVPEGGLVGTGSNDSLLTRITQLNPVYVNFSFTDAEAAEIRRLISSGRVIVANNGRLSVKLKLANGETYPTEGIVDFTDRNVDLQTGTVRARAEFANPDGLLLPGQFVRATISGITLKDAVVIPQEAVMQGPQGTFVYVVDGESDAQMKPIELGRELGDGWIVRSGLEPGDRVITQGVMKVRPGSPVTVATAASSTPVSSVAKAD
ncbi:membrane fusion protein, multidrug efflux system [Pseudoxanthobacter soli DSM 19599]|uniref:Membrane fusion protein, multidrug efflux system n=1 Tax=Pseudoxanthobacter soli DSM 19599 TaxID=1123029 RepID=A0A1M7Z9R1_9HYPH|nr:efflux RND transporter periplasmic adaptor subunit [Pseudoxanthobacter soli]SHO61542.1 membrane fusion protein, multidrug efflux system [Pseudoxanthobacter soli DSM 19599]